MRLCDAVVVFMSLISSTITEIGEKSSTKTESGF